MRACHIMKQVWLCIVAVISASAPVISLDSVFLLYVFVSEAEVDMSRCSTVRWTDTTVSSYNGMSIWNLNPEGLYLLFRQFAKTKKIVIASSKMQCLNTSFDCKVQQKGGTFSSSHSLRIKKSRLTHNSLHIKSSYQNICVHWG